MTVQWNRVNANVEVRVVDEGPGLTDTANIFVPFFTTKQSGIGLGLPSVKKIVEEHGGTIAIGSAPGEGTTVTIRLPGIIRGPAFRHRGRGRRHPRRPN